MYPPLQRAQGWRTLVIGFREIQRVKVGHPPRYWLLGLELNQPANVWGIETPPNDWMEYDEPGTLVDRVLNIWQAISLKKKSEETIVH